MKTQFIYYLDDDTDDLHFFSEAVETLGHQIKPFVSGNLMLRSLEKEKQLPDIIFLDIIMPVFNGEQILDIIKKSPKWSHIPVVLISGAYAKSAVGKYLESGANYLMKKPLDVTDLRTTVERVLAIDWKSFRAYC
ncbi:response regulator [Flavobacterium caeni]|uniref:CheY chemotaxis protein or a CheY-like REC (Receiver) domain n=1 Tax=Flavobacterium caeni TaxID=490189 RepID=A0A1G5JJL3_9FLAO|nr:response regulator [Flavobacterium caeni]SCY88080.1 CheY chemotaxis protein or a CheY-like REC (receiver) domain [Flavobacterium caeni]